MLKDKFKMLREDLEAHLIEKEFSGVVSISVDHESIFEKAFGLADRQWQIRNTSNTRFGIASGTKLLTALGILILVERKLLSLDQNVLPILLEIPEFKERGLEKIYSPEITIRHLLMHASGIPDYFEEDVSDEFGTFQPEVPWNLLRKPADYFQVFPIEPMKFEPGTAFAYNNGGFVILAAIIEAVSNCGYHEFIETEVLQKCHMDKSGFFELDRLPENTAIGYIKDQRGWHSNIYSLPIIGGGDGGLFTCLEDVAKLWEHLLKGDIISIELLKGCLSTQIKALSEGEYHEYGLGIWILNHPEFPREVYILGCDAGVSFKSVWIESEKILFTVMSNTTSGAWQVVKEIRRHLNLNP